MVDRCKDRHRFELERRKDKLTFRPRKALTWVVVSVKMYTKLRRGCVLGRNEGKKDRKQKRKIGKRNVLHSGPRCLHFSCLKRAVAQCNDKKTHFPLTAKITRINKKYVFFFNVTQNCLTLSC